MKKLTKLTTSLVLFLTAVCGAAQEWDGEYHRLKVKIEEEFPEPKGQPGQLELYLRWMETKARDREEVGALLEKARSLSRQDPKDELLGLWVQKFSELYRSAQASGENTVNGAVMRFMRIQDPQFPKASNWQVVIERLRDYGRRILKKAEETRFVTPDIRKAAQCMINYSIRDVEGNPYGLGVYEGREGQLNIPTDRDFDVDCEPRSSFTYSSKGRPSKPTDLGLSWINQVREEARWWNLGAEEKDATDLMEEFYRDSLCLVPPNPCPKGHRHYHQLAEQYRLPKAIRFNEGFYATLYGKVELVSASGRSPAQNAQVTVKAPLDGQTWKTQTDEAGRYEIHKVLLHRECTPLEITAEHRLGQTRDFFFGPLSEPDLSCRHEKNLEIHTAVWEGIAFAQVNDHIDWQDEKTERYPDGSIRDKKRERFHLVEQYYIAVRFRYDPKQEKLLSHQVQALGGSTTRHWYYTESYGRCRKGGAWQVVDQAEKKDDLEETRLENRVGKVDVSIASNPGGSFFLLSIHPGALILHHRSRKYGNYRERKLICTQKTLTEPPVESTMELPFTAPFAFSQRQMDPRAKSFQGEKRLSWRNSFWTSLRGSVPHHTEMRYYWHVWKN